MRKPFGGVVLALLGIVLSAHAVGPLTSGSGAARYHQASSSSSSGGGSAIFGETFEGLSNGVSVANTRPTISSDAAVTWLNRDGGSNGVNIVVATIGGSKALSFPYVTTAGGGRQEQRYGLDTTGTKQIREVWAEYKLYIPVGWVHSLSNGNCKNIFFYNDDTGNTNFYDFESWPIQNGAATTPPDGSTYLNMQLKTGGTNVGFGNTFNAPHTTSFNYSEATWFGKDTAYIDSGTDPGTWISIRIWLRMSSGSGANDARVRVWKNSTALGGWTKILEFLDFNDWNSGNNGSGHSNQHVSGGYILGSHNYDYAADTNYAWDDFYIYTTDPGWGLN